MQLIKSRSLSLKGPIIITLFLCNLLLVLSVLPPSFALDKLSGGLVVHILFSVKLLLFYETVSKPARLL